MPISSAEIAQLNGSFAQQYAQQMQYASMIGQGGPFGMSRNPYASSEGMVGGAMNRAGAIGAPLAMGGLALMGMDPASLAFRAGVGAYGAGAGFGGAALAGGAAFGGASLGLAGVSYMGNQMFTGAQQVQGFNQNMRGAYQFSNPGNYGGRGFGQTDLREIGSSIRGLASTGEQGFDELGRLAAQMGRMGMAEGVRNAKEFSEKFRDMMSTVKTIAKEMSTTLEEAQTMMASMRSSGIFKNQGSVAQSIRSSAVAGGLATTEVTGMMNVGSQISRMFGGTGRAGAMGGMEAITQIGTARQSGVLSEEDIYNATGLTGAEGRRALAMNQMQGTGQFLRSSKGRWFLASVAGKDGNLDPESVANWMAGGMGVDDTRRQAHGNLARVGRANFIRNEGRLRGSVMEQFGGLAPAMAMAQWAQGRGIDINDMDDRSMLFAQRQLGMGRDEADVAMKMARRLPELLQARRESRQDDMFMRENAERQKLSGLEGIKTRFDKARNSINNEMQRVGQDIMNVASESLSRWANRIADNYEERSIEGIREAHRAASMGGAGGVRMMGQLIGKGSSDAGLQGLIRGAGGASGMTGVREDVGMQRYREHINDLRFSANMGEMGSLSGAGSSFVSSNKETLQRAYAMGMAGLQGEDRISAMQRMLKKHGFSDINSEFKNMSAGQRAAFVQQVEREIGIKEGSRIGDVLRDPGMADLRGGGGPATATEFHEMRGREMLGLERKGMGQGLSDLIGTAGRNIGGASGGAVQAAGSAVGLYGRVQGSLMRAAGFGFGGNTGRDIVDRMLGFGGDFISEFDGSSKQARGASQFLDSDEGRRMVFGMFQGDKGSLEAAQAEASDLLSRTAKGDKLTDEEQGRLGIIQRSMVAADLQKKVSAAGGLDKMRDKDWDSLVESARTIAEREGRDPNSVTRETVKQMYGTVGGAVDKQRRTIISRIASQSRKSSLETSRELRAGGIAELAQKGGGLVLTKKTRDRLAKEGGAGAVQAAEMALTAENMGAQVQGREDTIEEDAALLEQQQQMRGRLYDNISNMSAKDMRALARITAGTDLGGMVSEQMMLGNRMRASLRRGGAAKAFAGELGISLSKDELAGFKGLSSDETAARLAQRMGVQDEGFQKQLAEAVSAAQSGPGGAQRAASLLHRAVAQADPKTREKILESQGRGPDPIEKIATKIGEGNRYLEALVKSNKDAVGKLAELNNKAAQDGEKS